MKTLLKLSLLFALAAVVYGCGSSDRPPPPQQPPPTSGIGRTGVSLGTISNFGSVVVNGVHYETSTAVFTIDDAPGSQSDLSVGQVVFISGTSDDDFVTGSADSVSFDDNVEGPVQSIDLTLGQLVVLGQTVIVGPDTSFDDSISPASLSGLTVGDIVEVSGFVAANGDIAATRIELKPAGLQFEVHGVVSGLDTNALKFSLNALVVDYSAATLDDFPGGVISDGDFVEAKGNSLSPGGELLATKVEFETPGIAGAPDAHVEVEGLITRFATAQDFDVAGIPVITDSATVFTGGVAGDLGLNIKVEVEGTLDANSNVILADKVDIRRAKIIRVTALIDTVDSAGNSLVMLGITFNVDELTRFEDKSDADLEPLVIGDLNAGDYLEVRGSEMPAGSGEILVGILEREDVDTETILQGFVASVSDPTLTILGVTIETNGATEFQDTDDSIITAAEFFSRVQAGSLIKAKGVESSATTIVASDVSFELEI